MTGMLVERHAHGGNGWLTTPPGAWAFFAVAVLAFGFRAGRWMRHRHHRRWPQAQATVTGWAFDGSYTLAELQLVTIDGALVDIPLRRMEHYVRTGDVVHVRYDPADPGRVFTGELPPASGLVWAAVLLALTSYHLVMTLTSPWGSVGPSP